MKKYFIFLAILLCGNFSVYASHASNLEGNYDCKGTEVGTGDHFTCAMGIQKTGETYSLKSTCSDNTSYIGTGIYDENKHNISFVFVNPKNSDETGVVVAEIKKNNAMSSTWTYLNKTTVSHGACSKRV